MPRGHEHIPTYSLSINARLPKVFLEEDSKGKKDRLDVIMTAFIPEKYTVTNHISNAKRV